MDDGSSRQLTNTDRIKGLKHIFNERSGLITHFKRDFGEKLFNEFLQSMFIISGTTVWKLTRGGEEYCDEFFN
jgi:hypothetical protein